MRITASAAPRPWLPIAAGRRLEGSRDRTDPVDTVVTGQPPLLAVPDTRQGHDYSCGASALQAVLMYYGLEYSELELMEMLGTDPREGTPPDALARVAGELGFQSEVRENLTLEDLEAILQEGVPAIVDCQAWRDEEQQKQPWSEVWESGHYMVLVGMDAENLYFEDPSLLGSRGSIPRAEFEERWHDYESNGKVYHNTAIVVRGKPAPPPAVIYVP
ncbi:MAG: C39 family peptidase [Armatimonadetes bacterium]|nr:C39 family peptidase [Armatimonadota bacterium]